MSFRRFKSSFTSGLVSPLITSRWDNERYKNGCFTLKNMHVLTQGPARRRSGFQFIYDLSSLGIDDSVRPRAVPFVFSETQAYVLFFYKHTGGAIRVVFGTETGLVEDSGSPGDPYAFEFTGTLDLDEMHYAQSADILYITQPTRMPIEFKRLAADNWSANEVSVTTPPFIINKTNITLTPSGATGTITLTASASLFTAAYVDQKMKLNSGIVHITTYTDATHVTGDVVEDLSSADATSQWYAQEWSAAFGYPRFVGFFEQRLFYASNTSRPQTIWFSQSGDYYDFSVSSPVVASDACTFTLDSGTQNKIQWVKSSRQLIIGTLGDEWSVGGSGYEPLSFSSIQAHSHTNHGGEALTALRIGPVILFLERLGRKVEQLVYDFNSDSYTSVDLSVLAPDLTDNYTIIDWTYQQTPNGIVWSVRDDGELLGLTFKREHDVVGWHEHDTQGEFISCSSIPGAVEDDLWVIVKRTIGGTDKYFIEKKAPEFLSDDVLDSYFLDSFLVYEGVAADTISGLDHLEGMKIDVLGEGMVFSGLTVTNGEVTLSIEVEKAVAGLSYTSELVPVPQEYEMKSGSSFTRIRRTDHIDVLLHQSLGLVVGRYDSEEGEVATEEVPFRSPADAVNAAVPLSDNIIRVALNSGADRSTRLFVRQTQPLPLTVLGLVDEVYLEV